MEACFLKVESVSGSIILACKFPVCACGLPSSSCMLVQCTPSACSNLTCCFAFQSLGLKDIRYHTGKTSCPVVFSGNLFL